MSQQTRSILLANLAVSLLVVVAISRWTALRNYFDRERVDTAAMADLEKVNLKPVAIATTKDWSQWRGPNRDGVAPAGPFRTDWKANPPKLLWTAPCGGGYGQPVIVNGLLYLHDFADGKERLRCLDANSGDVKWEHAEPADYSGLKMGYASGPRATPTVHDGHIYTVGATGRFQCLNLPAAGESKPTVLWSHDLLKEFDAAMPTWGVACSSLIVGETVVVQPGGKKGSVAAFDRLTGNLKWSAGRSPSGYSSPILSNGHIIAATGESLTGIGTDGNVKWTQPWATQYNGNIATPVVVGDYVFISSNYVKGCGLFRIAADGSSASEVYFRKNRVMSNHHSTCVYRDGHLFGYDGSELACVDFKKGERVPDWHAADDEGREFAKGSLTLVGENLLGLTESGTLFLGSASPAGFTFLGQVKNALGSRECWAAPVVVDGRIFLRDGEKVVCYDVR
jgi:outer membrane protein assembly factor BamB